jgi:F5/8 type C domain
MRVVARLWPRLLPVLGGILASCTPRADLDAYSAGAEATDGAALQPEGEGASNPASPAVTPPTDPAATSSDQPPATASDPDEMAANADGQTQPGGLAGGSAPEESSTTGSEPTGGTPPAEEPGATEPEPPVPPTTPPPSARPQFRFVRLVADTEIVDGPLTSIAEFGVLGPDGQPLARDGWVATADAAEATFVGGAPAAMAIDGDAATMWHTPWFQVVPPPHPHYLQVDLGQPRPIAGFRYLARQDGQVYGRIGAYRFFVSVDGVEWGEPVVAGRLADSALSQDVSLVSAP